MHDSFYIWNETEVIIMEKNMNSILWKKTGLLMALIVAAALSSTATPDGKGSGNKDARGERPSREEMRVRFDTDGDGQLSEEERAAMREARGDGRGERPSREELLERFDADGDGELSEQERAALREEMGRRRGPGGERPSREELLEKYDTDGDGQLSEKERRKMQEDREKMQKDRQKQQNQEQ